MGLYAGSYTSWVEEDSVDFVRSREEQCLLWVWDRGAVMFAMSLCFLKLQRYLGGSAG